MDIQKIFEYALQREIEGKRFFENNASRLSHAAAVSAFTTLVGEEQKHIEFIQTQLDALVHQAPLDPEASFTPGSSGFFSQRAASEFIDQTVAEAMVPDLPILRMAYLIERDFSEFYENAAQKVSGEAGEILMILAHWERGHERLLKLLHDRAFELYSEMPWGG
jgi:rubrerythrin